MNDRMTGGSRRKRPMGRLLAVPVILALLSGCVSTAGLAEQDALYDQAVAHYNKTLISALGEVAEHLDAMQSLRRQINIQRHVMALAQASWDIAKQRYRSGVGSYLEVLSAQQPLLDAEQKAATLNAEQIDLSVRLIGALGGGFRTEQQSPVAATGESTSNSSFKELP